MRRVIVETPFAATTDALEQRNRKYLRAAMRDCGITLSGWGGVDGATT